jgi:hypothetical protein
MRIIDVCEITKPIASPIRNAYIDFSKMTASLVAVVTDVVRRRVAWMHKIVTEQIQPKQHVNLRMILRRSLV